MKLEKSKGLKIGTLALCWSTLSFLFLYLANRWNIPKKWIRNTLFFISPLVIVCYIMTILFILVIIEYNSPGTFNLKGTSDYDYVDSERLERISGIYLDTGEILNEDMSEPSFNGDYSCDFTVELYSKPDYTKLDSLVRENKWMKYDGVYSFNALWGNDFPAPSGEDDDEDRFLTIRIPENSDTITITTGKW